MRLRDFFRKTPPCGEVGYILTGQHAYTGQGDTSVSLSPIKHAPPTRTLTGNLHWCKLDEGHPGIHFCNCGCAWGQTTIPPTHPAR